MYNFISKILDVILVKMSKSLYVIGKENIPKDSKYVVTCTHESYNEVIMLGMALLPNQIHYMAKKELFKNQWAGKFLKSLNAFPVDRENPGPSTLKKPVNLLKEHKTIGIFPTGHFSRGSPIKTWCSYYSNAWESTYLTSSLCGSKKNSWFDYRSSINQNW